MAKNVSLVELAIAKSLGGQILTREELKEMNKLTVAELISEHSLDLFLAEKVKLHVQQERQRLSMQDQFDVDLVGEREMHGSFTRTHPVPE